MDEVVNMSNRNIDRLRAIRDVIDGKLTQIEAGAILKRSDRQIRRLCEKVRRQGNAGIRHLSITHISESSDATAHPFLKMAMFTLMIFWMSVRVRV